MYSLKETRKANKEFREFCSQFNKVYAEYKRLVVSPHKNPHVTFQQFVDILFMLGIKELKTMSIQQVLNFVENENF